MATSEPPSNCPTFVLPDDPAQTDAFGIYDRLVDSLAETVTNDQGGKAIGLVGSWGSGKSTVVQLLDARLAGSAACLWQFDAWAHEGDPLRRSFLDNLLRLLEGRGWLTREFVKEQQEQLSGTVKRSTASSTPRLTLRGVVAVVLTLLIPLGLTLLSSGLNPPSPPDEQLVVYGSLLALSPLVALALFWFAHSVWEIQYPDAKANKESLFGLLYKETITDVETTTRENPEPTSIEFEDAFRKILSQAFSGGEERRLVLIIDNLDRIDRDAALEIWSTLQTFLQREAAHRPKWAGRVWVIVPHAREGIERFQPAGPVGEGKAEGGSAFLEKSLQITINLPLPVTSKWREFFLAQLATALPNHAEDDLNSVLRVFAMKRSHRDRAPTAREMKTFINEVAALHRIRLHEFPLSHLAYFVLVGRNVSPESVATQLRSRVIPTANDLLLTSGSLTNSVAALLYGTDADTALQVLLQEPILNALQTPNPAGLKELTQAPGFWSAFDTILDENVPDWKTNPVALASASRAIETSGVLLQGPATSRNTAIELLQQTVATTYWTINKDVAEGLVSAVRLSPVANAANAILQAFRAGYSHFQFNGAAPDAVASLVEAVLIFVRGMRGLQFDPTEETPFVLPIHATTALAVGQLLHKDGIFADHSDSLALANPTVAPEHIGVFMVEGRFSGDVEHGLKFVFAIAGPQDWTPFFNSAGTRLGPQFMPQMPEAEAILRGVLTIASLSTDARASAKASSLRVPFEAGYIAHEFAQASPDSESFAYSIAASMLVRSEPLPVSHAGNSGTWQQNVVQASANPQPELVKHLSAIIERYDLFSELWQSIAASPSVRPLLISVANALGRDTSLTTRRFPPDEVIANWAFVRETWLADHLFDSTEWVQEVSSRVLSHDFTVGLADFYLKLVAAHEDATLLEYIQRGADTVTQDTWQANIPNESPLLRLATGASGHALNLGLPYRDALSEVLRLAMVGQLQLPVNLKAEDLLAPLDEDGRTIVFTAAARNLAAVGGIVAEAFLRYFDSEMPEILATDTHSPQTILGTWVEARNQPAIAWLAAYLEVHPELKKQSQRASLLDLRDRLKASEGLNAEWDGNVSRLLRQLPAVKKQS